VIDRRARWREQQLVQQAEVGDSSDSEGEFARSREPHEFTVSARRRSAAVAVGLSQRQRREGWLAHPSMWHRVVVAPHHAPGFDGVINDFYFVRSATFEPRGMLSDDQLAAENLLELQW
jgi:8-oxo-dGTP diphosphatase